MPEFVNIDFGRAMTEGARLVNGNLGMFLGYTLAALLIGVSAHLVTCGYGGWLVTGPLIAGFYYGAFKNMDGESFLFADLFEGWKSGGVYLFSIVTNILVWLVAFICLVPMFALVASSIDSIEKAGPILVPLVLLSLTPAIYLLIAYTLGLPLIVDHGIGFWTAAELSRKSVTRGWFRMFLFLILMGLILWVGTLMTCGLGLFWLAPWFHCSLAVICRDNFPKDEPEAWPAEPLGPQQGYWRQ